MKHLTTLSALVLSFLLAACTSTAGSKSAASTTAQVDYEGRPYAESTMQSAGSGAAHATAQTDYDGHPVAR